MQEGELSAPVRIRTTIEIVPALDASVLESVEDVSCRMLEKVGREIANFGC